MRFRKECRMACKVCGAEYNSLPPQQKCRECKSGLVQKIRRLVRG